MSKPPAAPAGLSLGPRSTERPASPTAAVADYTLVGTLDDPKPARIDQGGLVQPAGAGWSVDWWIGADDRWYFPSRESTVRQRRLGAGPVIETAVRIPSGDALHRCYPVSVSGVTATVIEVENDSPVPVALALALRPYGLEGGDASALSVAIGDKVVSVGGNPVLNLPRRPNERLATISDIADAVANGEALTGTAETSGPLANAVVLYPLPHRTKLRFVVTSEGQLVAPTSVPDIEAVQRGWDSVVEAGGRFELPDNGISERLAGARARLMINNSSLADDLARLAPGAGQRLQALAASGATKELKVPLLALAGTFPTRKVEPVDAAEIVAGAGLAVAVIGDRSLAEDVLEVLAQLTHLVERRKQAAPSGEALLGLSWALHAAGQHEAAVDLAGRASDLGHRTIVDGVGVPTSIDEASAAIERASATGAWGADDVVEATRFVLGGRGLAVVETHDELRLFPTFPTGWRGGNAEIHQAATIHGTASFAIRWHGYRPALLWDIDLRETDGGRPVTIRCPALDPDWSTTERRGETLLAGTADELPAPPSEGDSFA